jgi:hypothetical protein
MQVYSMAYGGGNGKECVVIRKKAVSLRRKIIIKTRKV